MYLDEVPSGFVDFSLRSPRCGVLSAPFCQIAKQNKENLMSTHFYPTTTHTFMSLKKLTLFAGMYTAAHITLAVIFSLTSEQLSASNTLNISHFLLFPIEVALVITCVVCAYLAIIELFGKMPGAIRSDYLSFRYRNPAQQ